MIIACLLARVDGFVLHEIFLRVQISIVIIPLCFWLVYFILFLIGRFCYLEGYTIETL